MNEQERESVKNPDKNAVWGWAGPRYILLASKDLLHGLQGWYLRHLSLYKPENGQSPAIFRMTPANGGSVMMMESAWPDQGCPVGLIFPAFPALLPP